MQLNKKTLNKLAKIQTRAANPGLGLERLPSCGEIQELSPGEEDQRWRGSLRTVMDGNWAESSEEKVEQESVPGSQIQQTKWTLGTKR